MNRRCFLLGAQALLLRGAVARDRVGCQTNAWKIAAPDFTALLERVRDLKRLGFATFECNVRFVEGQFTAAAAARRRIEDTGVRFFGPHTGLKWPLDQLRKYADGAAALGAGYIAVSGIAGMRAAEKIDTLNRFGEHCRGAALRLVYHNHEVEFSAGGIEMKQLLERTNPPSVAFLLDVGHAWREKADVPAFIRRHHERIGALHVRDSRAGKDVPMGEGDFDFAALAESIRETGWSGWLTLEEESLHSTDAPYVESVLANGRKLIRKYFSV
jgi:inosose dehydratase